MGVHGKHTAASGSGCRFPRDVRLERHAEEVVIARAYVFFFQAEDGIRDVAVTGVQTCALPIYAVAEAAALVNAVITATEVKTLALTSAGVRCADGRLASGTSTDAVVVAATGRGPRCRFGGPLSDLRAGGAPPLRGALGAGVGRRLEGRPRRPPPRPRRAPPPP